MKLADIVRESGKAMVPGSVKQRVEEVAEEKGREGTLGANFLAYANELKSLAFGAGAVASALQGDGDSAATLGALYAATRGADYALLSDRGQEMYEAAVEGVSRVTGEMTERAEELRDDLYSAVYER